MHTAQNRPFFGLIIYAKHKMLYCNDLYCDGGGGELKKKKKIHNFRRVGSVRPSVVTAQKRKDKIRVKIGKEKREETTIDKTK